MSQLELHPVLHSYLRMLAGPKPGRVDRYFDVRWRDDHARHGFGRQFVPANDLTRVARLVNQLAGWTDVYLPIMLRDRVFRRDAVTGHRYQVGDATAVSRSHLLWVDVDHEDAQARLDAFPHRPTVTVASGSPGRRHAYWLLSSEISKEEVRVANRKLAGHFDGDLAAASVTGMLRPTGTYNYKHAPRIPVQLVELAGSRTYVAEELVDGLVDPRPPIVVAPPSDTTLRFLRDNPTVENAHDALKTLDARIWMPALTGVDLVRDGRMCCPFHDDLRPSLRAYPDGRFYCYGCMAKGTIFDFASRFQNRSDKGHEFIYLRAELALQFLGVELPTPRSRIAA